MVEPELAATPALHRDVVVIGASAGGVEVLERLVPGLPAEFPAAVLVVLHVPAAGTSMLPTILRRHAHLPVEFARDGDVLQRGQVYVAPSDHHLLVRDGRALLSKGPRENGHRPAVDPLFRSAARDAGPRVIGVVLSGLLDDGAHGLQFVKQAGGAAVVQDPATALHPGMPAAALSVTEADRIVPAEDLVAALCELVEFPVPPTVNPDGIVDDPDAVEGDPLGRDRVELDPNLTAELVAGPPTALSCPECGGALWEDRSGGLIRFACHVGHAYSAESLVEEQGRALETTLWSAIRALEERADLRRRVARRTSGAARERLEAHAADTETHASELRAMLERIGRAAPAVEPAA